MKRITLSILTGVMFTALSFVPVFAVETPSANQLNLSAFFTEEQLRTITPETEQLILDQLNAKTTKEALEREVKFFSGLLDQRVEKIQKAMDDQNNSRAEKLLEKTDRRMMTALKLRRMAALRAERLIEMRRAKALQKDERAQRTQEIRRENSERVERVREMTSFAGNGRAKEPLVVVVESVDAVNGVIYTTRGNKDVRVPIYVTDKTQLTKFNEKGERVTATLADFTAGDRIIAVVRASDEDAERLIGVSIYLNAPKVAQ